MINRQEIFTKSKAALLKQGAKSMREVMTNNPPELTCAYRGDNGTKCALGHLIPDELYSPKMEGSGPGCLLYTVTTDYAAAGKPIFEKVFPNATDMDVKFLGELQCVHDQNPVEDWPEQFVKLAERWGLNDE